MLQPLFEHSHQLLVEFPENAQLIHLGEAISSFVNKTPASAPLMKHAAQLERILGLHFKILSRIKNNLVHAEEWESISDRAHSIRKEMIPLQELLVEWRRREVQCWSELINYVQNDTTQLTVLVGWPLFKCALDGIKGGKYIIISF